MPIMPVRDSDASCLPALPPGGFRCFLVASVPRCVLTLWTEVALKFLLSTHPLRFFKSNDVVYLNGIVPISPTKK